ncbi:ESX-1 secretion-associated protein [Mycolicibacterium sp. GF69]|uniref:type VII secretion target n=1 Tax=Mycolicibacterium sp. GF69 TaxID=2267251 RepID=UPI000DCCA61A|nr:type VII secretion target [Mycolicibacterium sp. GF69]RAV08219.1 ESX-1 secretion-associated protein [Mycolicibacterium sp. GF69]
MSGDELRVSAAHLGELAERQATAAADARVATLRPEGVDAAVRSTHGSIAAPTASALDSVLASRRSAGANIADASAALCDKLTDAAARYDRTDDSAGSALNAQMRQVRP